MKNADYTAQGRLATAGLLLALLLVACETPIEQGETFGHVVTWSIARSRPTTALASGKATATTTTAIPGRKSAIVYDRLASGKHRQRTRYFFAAKPRENHVFVSSWLKK